MAVILFRDAQAHGKLWHRLSGAETFTTILFMLRMGMG